MKRAVALAAAAILVIGATVVATPSEYDKLQDAKIDALCAASPGVCPTPTPSPTPTPTLAPTPSPTAAPTADPQPAFPIRATFYYPWFPEAWNQQGLNPFSHYTPTLGYYDTSAVVGQHVAAMQSAGVQAGIASWWGQGTPTDTRMPALLAAAGSFRWTLYYEPEGSGNPTSTQIAADLAYINANYGTKPGYLRVNGKPVIFVYGDATDNCATADRWKAVDSAFYVVLKVFSGYKTCASQPDGWHQYAPAVAEDHQTGYSFAISPGFWKANETSPRLTRDATRWQTNVRDMIASKEPWQLVTTFNEWGEGSGFEDTTQLGSTYRSLLGGSTLPSAAPTSTPVPTVAPTPTPISTASPSPSPTANPTSISHVVVVWLENHEATAVTSSSMPYLTSLGAQYGLSTQFYAIRHPSLPNYLAFWSGSTQGVTDDATYNFSGPSLSSQMTAAGRSWRTYAQDYPSTAGCHTGSSYTGPVDGPGVAGTYARKHNPAMSFTSVSTTAECAKIQPLANFDPSVNVAFVVPNLCNDAHDCSLSVADTFLKGFVPKVTGAPDWAHTLLVISWDEGSTSTNGGGRIYTVVMRPGLSGVTSATTHNHYSLLHTIESLNGLSCLGAACSANTLSEFLP